MSSQLSYHGGDKAGESLSPVRMSSTSPAVEGRNHEVQACPPGARSETIQCHGTGVAAL